LAGSSIQSPAESDGAAGEVNVDATNNGAEIEQNMIRDFDSGGDGGDSDEEGGEADVHNFQCRQPQRERLRKVSSLSSQQVQQTFPA
jgi:hypothetical protein